ncbi:proline-rich nuclear receptor coactivator 1 [Leptodactylus fuscus]|uniref:proline-rich nuclear receptor coactivator 1 n=1 Tax=Leptodactylus fuscus TaxID=238119 RepID=UPI003F4E6B66
MAEPEGGGGRRRGTSVSRARSCGRRKRRKNKVRSTPFPTRLHHHSQLQSRAGENGSRSPSPGPGEAQPARAAQYRQFRREVLRTRAKTDKKIVKSEKNNTSHSPAALRCEQRSLHKPQNKCKIQSIKSTSPKKTERLHTDSELTHRSVLKAEKKPFADAENVQNIKMKKGYVRDEIEKEINYAGAKFSDPPSPSVLPKPPSHWMGINGQQPDQCKELMTYHLKALLKVQL